MATETVSVRITRSAKRLLEELQARIAFETGKRYNLQDILAASVRVAARHRNELIEELEGAWRPLRPEEAERLLEELSFEGPREASREVDRVLYG